MKKIIVIGSGKSGSSAIVDYLSGRPDVYDPLKSNEFRLIQDPGGIISLHFSIGLGFQVNLANYALKEFMKLSERFNRHRYSTPPGLGYGKLIPNFLEKVYSYIDNITALNYHGLPYYERAKLPYLKTQKVRIQEHIHKLKGQKLPVGKVYLPVHEYEFLEKTSIFIDSILNNEKDLYLDKEHVLINQGGSFWNPLSSTQYYGDNRKVIVVTRDPRDIYVEMQTKGSAYPGQGMELFCEWYRNIMERINKKEWDSEILVHVHFEEFVNNFSEEKVKLDKALGIPNDIISQYDVSRSKVNVGKYQDKLTLQQKEYFNNRLREYLYL